MDVNQLIKAVVCTDFILSIEIIVIKLDSVFEQSLLVLILVVSIIAMLATIGGYGVAALLISMDDSGFYLIKRSEAIQDVFARATKMVGELLVRSLPKVIRSLTIVVTNAMLLVGGGMYVHNIDAVHHLLAVSSSLIADLFVGLLVCIPMFLCLHGLKKLKLSF